MLRWMPFGLLILAGLADAQEWVAASLAPGHLFKGSITGSIDEDVVLVAGIKGAKLTLNVSTDKKTKKSKYDLLPALTIVDVSTGQSLDLGGHLVGAGTKALVLKKFALPSTSEYRCSITGLAGTTGAYTVSSRLKVNDSHKKKKVKQSVASGNSVSIPLHALPGSMFSASVKSSTVTAILEGPGGRVELSTTMTASKTSLASGPLDDLGVYQLNVTNAGPPAKISVTTKVKFPKLTPAKKAKDQVIWHEPVIDPGTAPTPVLRSVQLDATLSLDPSSLPARVATPFGSVDLGAPNSVLDTSTEQAHVVFLLGKDGTLISPVAILPGDQDVVVSADRIALGIVLVHPWLRRVDPEFVTDVVALAPSTPSYAYLVGVLPGRLAAGATSLMDPTTGEDLLQAAHAIVEEALSTLSGPATTASGTVPTPCGDATQNPSFETFNIQAGTDGNVILYNPRSVFYGLRIVAPSGQQETVLVRPKDDLVQVWPPGFSTPFTDCLPLEQGETGFEARAFGFDLDLSTPGGMGTAANVWRWVFDIVELAVPLPVPSRDLASMLVENEAKGGLPGAESIRAAILTAIAEAPDKSSVRLVEVIGQVLVDQWDEVSTIVWQQFSGAATSEFMAAAGTSLKRVLTVIHGDDLAQFLPRVFDTGTTLLEGPLTSCAELQGVNVSAGECEVPPWASPSFAVSPTPSVAGLPLTFDPALTALSPNAESPTFAWTFDDFDGAPEPDAVSTSPETVSHTFSEPGHHMTGLAVSVGQQTYWHWHMLEVLPMTPSVSFASPTLTTGDVFAHAASIPVVLHVPNGTLQQPLVVTVSDAGDGSATPGSDYVAFGSRQVAFPVGSADKTMGSIEVDILPDSFAEGIETLHLSLAASPPAADVAAPFDHVLLIDDVDLGDSVHQVPEEFGTIQAAIDASESGDTVLVGPGTYLENLVLHGVGGADGIHLKSVGGPGVTTIDGGFQGPVIKVIWSKFAISGFSIVNGFELIGPFKLGYGISCFGSEVAIDDNVIASNNAAGVRISSCVAASISFNSITANGLTGIEVSDNPNHVFISGNSIDGNATGIALSSGAQAMIDSNTISHCYASASGNALNVQSGSSATFTNNVVSDNAISVDATVMVQGLSSALFVNNTIVDNDVDSRCRACAVFVATSDSSITVVNSIVRNGAPDEFGGSGTVSVTHSNVEGGHAGVGNFDALPELDPTYHLLSTSPCRDAGDTLAPSLPALDIDGEPRVAHGVVDVGADEYQ